MLHLRTLGVLDFRKSAGSSVGMLLAQPRSMALLIYLLVARPRGYVRRDTLCAMFWPDADDEHARSALSQALTRLRRAAGTAIVETRGKDEVGVPPDTVACDVLDFDAALTAGDYATALDLYKGPFLSGFHASGADGFEAWAATERDRLRSAAAGAARRLAHAQLEEGRPREAAQTAGRALSLAPESEAVAGELVRAVAAAGDRVGALAVYEAWVRELARELDMEPSPEFVALVSTLRDAPGDPPRDGPPDRVPPLGETDAGHHRPQATVAAPAAPAPDPGAGSAAASPPPRLPDRGRTFRFRDRLVIGGVATAILLLVGWGVLRASLLSSGITVEANGRAASPLARGDWLLVADFDMPGADTALALAFQTLLIQDLSSAGYASVVGGLGAFTRSALQTVLERMRLAPDTRIDAPLACQIAEREGAAGVLAGRVLPVGRDYVLSASVLTGPECQERIHASTVASFDDLSRAVTALSREMRERLGESRSSIRSSPPLPPTTSARVEALRAAGRYISDARYWRDAEHGDEPLLEAIRIEPDFAFAHFMLAIHYQRLGRFDRVMPHMLRAYALREELPRVGRRGMEALYDRYVASDLDAAETAAKDALAADPMSADASIPFLEDIALWRGDWQRALDLSLQHLRTSPSGIGADLSLARGGMAAAALGRTALADSLFRVRTMVGRRAGIELDPATELLHHLLRRDWQRAAAYCATTATNDACPYVDLARGKLAAAARGLQQVLADTGRTHPWDRAVAVAGLAHIAELTGQPERVAGLLQRARVALPDTGIARAPMHLSRFLVCAAAAELGRSDGVPACAVEGEDTGRWDADPSFTVLLRSGAWSRRLLAVRALERGDAASALLRDDDAIRSNFGNHVLADHLIRALSFDALQRPDSALSQYIEATRIERDGAFPTAGGILFPLAPVYRRIGELAEDAGDAPTAVRYYDAFTELWAEADPVLQPQVRSVAQRAASLMDRRIGLSP